MPGLLPYGLLHITQALVSAYALYPTYQSITQMSKYESKTKKLAKISNVADWHLWKTRKTLGFGTVGIISSLILSSIYTLNPPTSTLSSLSSSSVPATTKSSLIDNSKLPASLGLAVLLFLSHRHIRNYWRGSPKVPAPGMSAYNDAISSTALMSRYINILAASWGFVSFVYAFSYTYHYFNSVS